MLGRNLLCESSKGNVDSKNQPTSSTWVNDNFTVIQEIGSGAFGTVYLVVSRNPTHDGKYREFALKQLTQTILPKYIAMELSVLRQCRNDPNIMKMQASYRERDRVFIVMDYFEHDKFKVARINCIHYQLIAQDVVQIMTPSEILHYMENLLRALYFLHLRGYVHRDVKPSNFLYNRKSRRYSLIDFGLSREQKPSVGVENCSVSLERLRSMSTKRPARRLNSSTVQQKTGRMDDPAMKNSATRPVNRPLFPVKKDCSANSSTLHVHTQSHRCSCIDKASICSSCMNKPAERVNRAGTAGFRAPEVLLRLTDQTSAVDIWAAGVIFLSLCCKRHPILRPLDDLEALGQLATLFGGVPLQTMAESWGKCLHLDPCPEGVDLERFCLAMSRNDDRQMDQSNQCRTCRPYFEGTTDCLCRSNDSDIDLDRKSSLQFRLLRGTLKLDPLERFDASTLLALWFPLT